MQLQKPQCFIEVFENLNLKCMYVFKPKQQEWSLSPSGHLQYTLAYLWPYDPVHPFLLSVFSQGTERKCQPYLLIHLSKYLCVKKVD